MSHPDDTSAWVDCPDCRGQGGDMSGPCPSCFGQGQTPAPTNPQTKDSR